VESLNRSLRKIIKTRGSFPTDEAALKLLSWQSGTPAFTGTSRLNGRLQSGSLPFCSAIVLSPQRAEGSKTMERGSAYTKTGHSPSGRSGPRDRVPCSARRSCSRSCAEMPNPRQTSLIASPPAAERRTAGARPSPNTPSTASTPPWRKGEGVIHCVRYVPLPMSRAATRAHELGTRVLLVGGCQFHPWSRNTAKRLSTIKVLSPACMNGWRSARKEAGRPDRLTDPTPNSRT